MTERTELRQLVDWSAALLAGLVAGIVFLLANLFVVPMFVGGNAWVTLRLLGSVLLGPSVLAPPATFHAGALVVGLLVHFALSIGFTVLLAIIIHRFGLLVGIFGGALFGLALFCINVYGLTALMPWFYVMDNPAALTTHVLFGAVAGAFYESFEVEEFVAVSTDR